MSEIFILYKQPDFWTETETAIRRVYKKTDHRILKRKRKDVCRRGGSTAVTVIVINGEKLVVGNVGDSCAVISEGGIACQLLVDHEPMKERHTIENRGGFVTKRKGRIQVYLIFFLIFASKVDNFGIDKCL